MILSRSGFQSSSNSLLLPDGADQCAEVLRTPDHRHGIQGIGFLSGPGDHLIDVLVLNHIKPIGQAHLGVGFFDPADEGIGLLGLVGTFE